MKIVKFPKTLKAYNFEKNVEIVEKVDNFGKDYSCRLLIPKISTFRMG